MTDSSVGRLEDTVPSDVPFWLSELWWFREALKRTEAGGSVKDASDWGAVVAAAAAAAGRDPDTTDTDDGAPLAAENDGSTSASAVELVVGVIGISCSSRDADNGNGAILGSVN